MWSGSVVERPVDRATIRTFPLLLYVNQSVSQSVSSPGPPALTTPVTCGVDRCKIVGGFL